MPDCRRSPLEALCQAARRIQDRSSCLSAVGCNRQLDGSRERDDNLQQTRVCLSAADVEPLFDVDGQTHTTLSNGGTRCALECGQEVWCKQDVAREFMRKSECGFWRGQCKHEMPRERQRRGRREFNCLDDKAETEMLDGHARVCLMLCCVLTRNKASSVRGVDSTRPGLGQKVNISVRVRVVAGKGSNGVSGSNEVIGLHDTSTARLSTQSHG